MKYGFVLPKSTDGEALCGFARAAEELGFESVWTGDQVVLPTEETDQYPYTSDGRFTASPDDPQLDSLMTLSFVASATRNIRIGTSVIIVPYRNPIVQAKMFATLDVLTGGRAICGVGVGWLEKEFDVLGASHADRGPVTDEYLQVFKELWTAESPEFHGRFYDFEGIKFAPKPVQIPHIPIWVGGHTRRAIRRAVKYGNAWHPTRQTPEYVAGMLPYLGQSCEEHGRDPGEITVSLKRSLHFTDMGLDEATSARSGAALVATTQEVADDVRRCADLGIHQLTFDFRTGDVDLCIRTMERFADRVAGRT